MKLYRATNRKSDAQKIPAGSCWTADESAAKAYLDNPGFGGKYLVSIDIEPEYVLDLTGSGWEGDDWIRLTDELGYNESQDMHDQNPDKDYIEQYMDDADIRANLEKRYDWVVYNDTYPAQCVTYRKL